MANMTVTPIDVGSVALRDEEFQDDILSFSAAHTFRAGTLLARDATTLKLVPYVKGSAAATQNGIPKAVLTYEVAAGGAGDVKVRALVRGAVNKRRLVIDADGDDRNVDITVLDALRIFGILAVQVQALDS